MSITVASDVLVQASNRSGAKYRPSRSLVEKLAAGPELVYLFWPTLMEYLEEVTDGERFSRPLSARDAVANVGALLERPHVRAPGEVGGFWGYFVETLGSHTKGAVFGEAHLAGLMRQHCVTTVYSYNAAYKRFTGIEVREPPSDKG
ncbi:MAG TPA: type II toxin-antitoxin system VapC family toxin [Acidimicrobiales bacterium]|nr:type II toxin-antitoxin system VapC family toxin [Acidimicrobiales bacterium]